MDSLFLQSSLTHSDSSDGQSDHGFRALTIEGKFLRLLDAALADAPAETRRYLAGSPIWRYELSIQASYLDCDVPHNDEGEQTHDTEDSGNAKTN